MVVPVDGKGVLADEEQPDAAVANPAPVIRGGSAARGDKEVAENSVALSQDYDGFLPILEYNREPNKYGMAAEADPFVFQIYSQLKIFHFKRK